MKRRIKKASLNMSISTIVVLILAMTLLGFGLMFIRGIFSKAGNQFEQVSGDVEKLLKEKLKDNNARLVLQKDDFSIKKGQKMTTYFAIRNDLDDDITFDLKGNGVLDETGNLTTEGAIIKCYNNDNGDGVTDHITFQLPKRVFLKQGDVKVFPLTIKVTSSARTDTTYYCKMVVWGDNSLYETADFTIYVKS